MKKWIDRLFGRRDGTSRTAREDLERLGAGDVADELMVEVIFADDDRTCQAVRALDGVHFKVGETPKLPVPGCDADWNGPPEKSCRCVYGYVTPDF